MKRNMYLAIGLLLPLDDRADLDPVTGPGLRDLERCGHVRRLDDAEAADRLLRLGERTVDDGHLAVRVANGRRRRRALQLFTTVGEMSGRVMCVEPLEDLVVDALRLGARPGLRGIAEVEQRVLGHVVPPWTVLTPTTNGAPHLRQPRPVIGLSSTGYRGAEAGGS